MNQICEQKNSLKTGRNHCNLLNRRKGFIVFCFIILQPNKSNEPLKKKIQLDKHICGSILAFLAFLF
jgi:hypothetical protein